MKEKGSSSVNFLIKVVILLVLVGMFLSATIGFPFDWRPEANTNLVTADTVVSGVAEAIPTLPPGSTVDVVTTAAELTDESERTAELSSEVNPENTGGDSDGTTIGDVTGDVTNLNFENVQITTNGADASGMAALEAVAAILPPTPEPTPMPTAIPVQTWGGNVRFPHEEGLIFKNLVMPPVPNASVAVYDGVTNMLLFTVNADGNGIFTVPGLDPTKEYKVVFCGLFDDQVLTGQAWLFARGNAQEFPAWADSQWFTADITPGECPNAFAQK